MDLIISKMMLQFSRFTLDKDGDRCPESYVQWIKLSKCSRSGNPAADEFVIMARTDAVASEGLQAAIDRACAYAAAGADMIFGEALQTLAEYRQFTQSVSAPVLANITEFGKTPLFTVEELREVGVRLVLYPLSAFRAMSAAAGVLTGRSWSAGTQQAMVAELQTRRDLYDVLNYHAFEEKLDELFAKRKRP